MRPYELLDADELLDIHEKVFVEVRNIWGTDTVRQLPITECTRCPGPPHFKLKQHCIVDMVNHEALCPSCWSQKREQDLINAAIVKKPKLPFPVAELRHGSLVPLDVEDFSRV